MAVPVYEAALSAYHEIFREELRRLVEVVPLSPGDRIMDIGSGDGFFASLLLDRLGNGSISCVDADPSYLSMARARLRSHPRSGQVSFHDADVRRLPFGPGVFDLAWCAQSLYSFPDPVLAMREIVRTVRPGGLVVVLENDLAHHVLLPWPPEVEMSLRAAELEFLRERNARADRFFIGRGLTGVFEKVGVRVEAKRTFSWDLVSPFTGEQQRFLAGEVNGLRERAWDHLSPREQNICGAFLSPASPMYVLSLPGSSATVIDQVVWGRKT